MRACDYDVIVVGGGPAGAAAARAAAGGGLRTLIVERKEMPRLKPCAGYIFREAREFLDQHYPPIPDTVMSEPRYVKEIRLYVDSRLRIDVKEEALSVWRDRFDAWLCEGSGAEIWNRAELRDFSEWRDRVDIVCRRGDKEIELSTRVLIAADGGLSRVAGKIDPTFIDGAPYICTRHEYHRADCDLEPGIFHVFLDAEYGVYPAVYFKDDLMVIDTSVPRGRKIAPTRGSFQAMLARDFSFRSRHEVSAHGCRVAFTAAVNRFCSGTDRVLVAGEAAGFMNALGEGISSALATGRLAGLAAVASGGSPPGLIYRHSLVPERDRTAREWSLLSLLSGGARPELNRALSRLTLLDRARFLRAVLAWRRGGGVAPGINRDYIEVALRRLLHGSYDFRS
ncbi:MAG: FAD-dependent oxidoreductase [Actinobacteria bacterium]|nr:MAG: FAD-dependent oxidoreductase [Actinomycetota bacterium]